MRIFFSRGMLMTSIDFSTGQSGCVCVIPRLNDHTKSTMDEKRQHFLGVLRLFFTSIRGVHPPMRMIFRSFKYARAKAKEERHKNSLSLKKISLHHHRRRRRQDDRIAAERRDDKKAALKKIEEGENMSFFLDIC